MPVKAGKEYKSEVSGRTKFKYFSQIDKHAWSFIIPENFKKANFIVNAKYDKPEEMVPQDSIFCGQLERFIKPHSKVAVLSGLPLFLIEYYGKDYLYNQLAV
ncbi:MAG: hypothetical protein ACYC4Q_01195 [Victivallaceae bacterium]